MDTSTKDRSAFNIVSGKIRLENKVYQVEIEVLVLIYIFPVSRHHNRDNCT